ncbi:MAG: fatty acid--CoA ligase family protein [Anaerolineae bacterium]
MINPAKLLLPLGENIAIVWQEQKISYVGLFDLVQRQLNWLDKEGVSAGSIVGLRGDFSPLTISMLLALFSRNYIVAMLPVGRSDVEALCVAATVDYLIDTSQSDSKPVHIPLKQKRNQTYHPLINKLAKQQAAGFIIFSSGSSGKPKPILHSLERFLGKYSQTSKPFITLSFLLLDHIAGIDTLFYILFSGGTLVAPEERGPNYICGLIEAAQVEVLPVSPSFLNLLWLSGDFEKYQLDSVKIVTFGSEPMTSNNLNHAKIIFPNATIKQKYGTSEFGSPASKSREDDQLWIQLDGEQFETKVVDGILFVKSQTTMLGYLDDSEPMFVNGWYNTGDRVEVDGEWLRILGRESDVINVGGEKVFPSEVEAVIQAVEGVVECSVYGEPNPITGNIVCAAIFPALGSDLKQLKKLIKRACSASLLRYKVPVKIKFSEQSLTNDRQKKVRKPTNGL